MNVVSLYYSPVRHRCTVVIDRKKEEGGSYSVTVIKNVSERLFRSEKSVVIVAQDGTPVSWTQIWNMYSSMLFYVTGWQM